MATVGELLILIAGNNAPLTASLAASEAQLRGFSASTAATGTASAGHFGAVALAAGAMAGTTAIAAGASIAAAASFQDQLAIINTIAHQTPEELNRTGEAIRAMAVSSGEPLSSLTSAFYELLSAGVPVSQAMSVLGSSTTLAIGGLATTKQTVDLLTTAMNAYGLTANGVKVATDQFALAIQDGKVTADQIAGSFADIAPIAKQSGIGIDEIAAAYATLTARGVPAAEVTTQMNRAIVELLKPNADLVALQKETGENFAQIARQQGLVVALQDMREAADRAGVPFTDLFGRLEGMKFALATTGPAFRTYQDELVSMHSATGTAAAQAAERMDTFNRSGAILGNSLQDLAITVGNGFLPQITAFVQNVAGAVQGAAAWADANPRLANTSLLVVGAQSALIAGLVFLGPVIGAIGTAFGILTSPITLVAAAVAGLAAHFGLLGEGPKSFVDGLASSLNALLPQTGPVRDALNFIGDAIGAIPGVISGAQSAIGDFVSTLQTVWAQISPDVVAAVGTAFNTISGAVQSAASAFGPLITDFVNFVTSAGFVQGVVDAARTGFDLLRGAVGGVVTVIQSIVGWISTFLTHLTGANDAGRTSRTIWDGVADAIRAVASVLSTIISVISTVVTAIVDAGNRTGAFKLILDALGVAGDIINQMFAQLGDYLRVLFALFGEVASVVSGAVSGAFTILKGVIDALAKPVQAIIDALKAVIDFAGQAAAAVGSLGGPSGDAKDFQDKFREKYGRNPTHSEFDQYRNGTLPGFASGGIVPGPVGSPMLAVVHGGEQITPAGQGGPIVINVHSVIQLEGEKVGEILERRLFNSASVFSSGFVGSPSEP